MQTSPTLTPAHGDAAPVATPAELVECARVLALSLAEHRARFGVVPLVGYGAKSDSSSTANALNGEASRVLSEALALIRRQSRAATVGHTETASPGPTPARADKRRQLRVSVTAPAQVSDPAGTWLLAAMVCNISWGGAALQCTGLNVDVGQQLRLHLPAGGGKKISILSTVLRVRELPQGCEFGLRFDSLSPADEARLQQVLELLVSAPEPDGRRVEARLVQRLEIEYGDVGEFKATLEDISVNGLMLMVPDPLEIDQSLLISLSSADTEFNLNLRARVMHQTRLSEGGLAMYRVGLQFEHPDVQVRERVSEVIHQLATLPPAAFENYEELAKRCNSGVSLD